MKSGEKERFLEQNREKNDFSFCLGIQNLVHIEGEHTELYLQDMHKLYLKVSIQIRLFKHLLRQRLVILSSYSVALCGSQYF